MKNNNFEGQVIPINRDNVDTDLIIPKQYLKSIKKSGFGPFLFDSLRYTTTASLDSNSERTEVSSFILNQTPYNNGTILIAKSNFRKTINSLKIQKETLFSQFCERQKQEFRSHSSDSCFLSTKCLDWDPVEIKHFVDLAT